MKVSLLGAYILFAVYLTMLHQSQVICLGLGRLMYGLKRRERKWAWLNQDRRCSGRDSSCGPPATPHEPVYCSTSQQFFLRFLAEGKNGEKGRGKMCSKKKKLMRNWKIEK
jgi:hypothetical protein